MGENVTEMVYQVALLILVLAAITLFFAIHGHINNAIGTVQRSFDKQVHVMVTETKTNPQRLFGHSLLVKLHQGSMYPIMIDGVVYDGLAGIDAVDYQARYEQGYILDYDGQILFVTYKRLS